MDDRTSLLLPDDGHRAVRRAFDAPWPGPRGPEIRLAADDVALTVRPVDGCRIGSLAFFGHEVLRPWTPERRAFQYGCFPMIPWVGRLADGILAHAGETHRLPVNKPPHALHGMACFAPWRTVEAAADRAVFAFDLGEPWPWRGTVTQTLRIVDGALETSLVIEAADTAFPADAGWHPWFRKDLDGASGRLELAFAADWQEEPGSNEVPTGRRIAPRPGPWDDCFGFEKGLRAKLIWPGLLALDVASAARSMVVFDKQPDATCLNPLSGPPNGVNTAPHLVAPGAPLVIEARWTPSRA